jgi:glycosyltransferase involved in cell wall biosynthesis
MTLLETGPTATDVCGAGAIDESVHRRRCRGHAAVNAAALHVIHLSFEGPDPYSRAGGLAVRVSTLDEAIAATGVPVDLYFVGDPSAAAIEHRRGVTLHRWCQSISAGAAGGVYEAEEDKIAELCTWWPRHVAERIMAHQELGVHTVVLAEDWHTAWPVIGLHDELVRRGSRCAATVAWTANNRFGFDRIDFPRLAAAATIVTISKAMKHLMWQHGVNPLVVPNGIPDDALQRVDASTRRVWRECTAGVTTLAKVGRWDPDKQWHAALRTVAELRNRGERAVLLARGWNGDPAASAHHAELRAHAAHLQLPWSRCHQPAADGSSLARMVARWMPAGSGVIELTEPIAGPMLRSFYSAATMVLANSGFEPFGLVGIEAMAAGGTVVTGSTGEDYVQPFVNGFAADTGDPTEVVRFLSWLRQCPDRAAQMSAAARATAERYRWACAVERLWLALGVTPLT